MRMFVYVCAWSSGSVCVCVLMVLLSFKKSAWFYCFGWKILFFALSSSSFCVFLLLSVCQPGDTNEAAKWRQQYVANLGDSFMVC